MNKTSIITVIIIVMGLVGLVFLGKSAQKNIPKENGIKSALITTESLYDFGTISMKDGDVTKEFTVTNPTLKDIFISTLVTSCMCTEAFMVGPDGTVKGPFGMSSMGYVPPVNDTIKAGESRIVRVVYDPNAHGPAGVGFVDRFVYLTDVSGSKLQLEIKAVVTP